MADPVRALAVGTIDGVNTDFETPSVYYPGTLYHYMNGQLLDPSHDDGLVETGGNTFRLKVAPRTGDVVHVWYHESAPSPGGAFVPPPVALWALELRPEPYSTHELTPTPHSTEGTTAAVDMVPVPQMAIELAPDPEQAIDLKPKPLSAEEV
jgi:hypothetical protein